MIKSLAAFSWLDKLFPTQASYTELTTSQQQRLKIIWASVAIFLVLLVFLALLLFFKTTIPSTTSLKNVAPTAIYQNTTPGQTLEFKATTPLDPQSDPNFTVVSGKVESDANSITFSMQLAGQILTNGDLNQVYQVGIDSDLDPTDGYLIPQVGLGAEYIADLDAAGNAVLLRWVNTEHIFQPVLGLTQKQIGNNQLVFVVSRAALGFPKAINIAFLASDQRTTHASFLPSTGFAHYQLPLQGLDHSSEAISVWPFNISYSQNAGVNSVELTQAVDPKINPDFDITNAKLSSDGTNLTVTLQVAGKIVADPTLKSGQQLYQLLLDTDENSTNNLIDPRLGLGSEFIADYDGNGFNSILRWLADSDTFAGVGGLHTDINGNKLTYIIPLQSLDNPATIRFSIAVIDNRSNQHNYLPDHSAASLDTGLAIPADVVLTSSPTTAATANPADASLIVTKANFVVKDGLLVATLKTAAPFSSSNLATASYQVWLGQPITQTDILTNTVRPNINNALVPNLRVYHKIIFTPANQTATIFSWSEKTQAFEYTQAIEYTAQQDSIELQLPLTIVGTGAVSCYIETFNPSDGFGFSLPSSTPQPLFLAGSAKYVLQASPTFSNSNIPLTNTLVTAVTLQHNMSNISFAVDFAQPVQTDFSLANYSKLQFWFDSDADPQTGATNLQVGLGVDYLIKYDQRLDSQQAQLYKYDTSSKSMLLFAQLPLQFSADRKHLDFILPLSKVNLNRFYMAVHAEAPTFNQSQILPGIERGFAIIDFQHAQSSQVLKAPVDPKSANSGEAYADLTQFELSHDNFFVRGRFALAGLPTPGVKAVYTINLATFNTDLPTTDHSDSKKTPTYYVLSYNTLLDSGVLERWDETKASYEFVSQIDRTLDTQHNVLELRVPYSVLKYPDYSYYSVSVTTATGTAVSLPRVGFDTQQQVAAFSFKNPSSNLGLVMKQN
jgi:hypothetical protein